MANLVTLTYTILCVRIYFIYVCMYIHIAIICVSAFVDIDQVLYLPELSVYSHVCLLLILTVQLIYTYVHHNHT